MNENSEIPHSHRRRPPWPPPPDPSVWGSDVQWLLQYDNIIKHPGGKTKGCHCDIHLLPSYHKDNSKTTNSQDRDVADGTPLPSASTKVIRSAGVSLEDLTKKVAGLDVKKSYGTLGRRPNTARPAIPIAQAHAGAVDEATFRAAFLNVPVVPLYGPTDLRDAFKIVTAALANPEEDWEKRVEAYRKIRSLYNTAGESTEFLEHLKKLETAIVDTFKDLRSQVVREACITIAFLAEKLKQKIIILIEFSFPNLLALMQNSAKIMSSSALVALRFIMENTHSIRLLNLTLNAITSKSKDIRRAVCEMMCIIFSTWPVSTLDKKHVDLKTALQKGIGDADPEARQFARKAFCSYKSKFPDRADELLRCLDASYRRTLDTGSVENVSEKVKQTPVASARSVRKSPTPERGNSFKRSNTAMDPHAVQRATARAQYAAMYRFRGTGRTPGISATPSMTNSQVELMDDSETPNARSRSRAPRYSRSQPTSRSASPCGVAMAVRPPPRVLSRSSIPSPIDTPRDISRRPSGSQIRSTSRNPDYGFSLALMRNETDGMRSMSGERSSDESETSSLGDRSYSGAPTSPTMPIPEVLTLLTKPDWIDRRDGLHQLRDHLRNSCLTPKELKRAVESLNRMFMDSQTKAYTLFLDTVKLLVQRHWHQLDDWLFLLLERLFLKVSSEVLPTTENNILDLLQLIRESFPQVSLFRDTFKIIVDPLQRYNIKFRLHLLKHLSQLALLVSKTQAVYNFVAPEKEETAAVLSKILVWSDVAELKDCCNKCIADLFHMNAPLITNASFHLSHRESEQIDVIVKKALKCPKEPVIETQNGEDINESLKLTSQEIQTYKYEDLQTEVNSRTVTQPTKKSLEERMAAINQNINRRSNEDVPTEVALRGYGNFHYPPSVWSSPNVWNEVFTVLRPESEKSTEEKFLSVQKLLDLIRSATPETIAQYTVKIIKCTVSILSSMEEQTTALDQVGINLVQFTFYCLEKVFRIKECIEPITPYVEILAVKTFNTISNKDQEKMVRFFAQELLHAMVEALPISPMLSILSSHALDGVPQSAYSAIKEINEIVKLKPKEEFYPHFRPTMDILMVAYGSSESAVRKAVTFCIVELYRVFGEEEVGPYIKKLDGSKRRLIDVYIKRQK